ncbi:hypothetical protein AGMMS49965_04230 [Bacteroidia bacterium]|nr:hypothetical protein AGMMS49965_04230 [Bacteroidia bacterium]
MIYTEVCKIQAKRKVAYIYELQRNPFGLMKRLLLLLVLNFVVFSTVLATQQIPDKLIIEKDTIYLESFPLENLKIKKAPFNYGEFSFPHTACWRGYVATWQVIDGYLVLTKIEKIDSASTELNIIEYLKNNGYNPKTINGFVLADWYSETLSTFYVLPFQSLRDSEIRVSNYKENDDKIKLVFENGKLIKNNIFPIESYKIGNKLCCDIYLQKNKRVLINGIIRANNGKMVRLEIITAEINKKMIQKETITDYDNFWVNPRHCKKTE